MAAPTDPMPPLLPVIPEYTPWLEKVRRETAADAARADATFAARHGVESIASAGSDGPPEHPRGAVADKTA